MPGDENIKRKIEDVIIGIFIGVILILIVFGDVFSGPTIGNVFDGELHEFVDWVCMEQTCPYCSISDLETLPCFQCAGKCGFTNHQTDHRTSYSFDPKSIFHWLLIIDILLIVFGILIYLRRKP